MININIFFQLIYVVLRGLLDLARFLIELINAFINVKGLNFTTFYANFLSFIYKNIIYFLSDILMFSLFPMFETI